MLPAGPMVVCRPLTMLGVKFQVVSILVEWWLLLVSVKFQGVSRLVVEWLLLLVERSTGPDAILE